MATTNLDNSCVKASTKTWWTILVAVVTFAVFLAVGYMDIKSTLARMESKQDMTISGCCPDEFKKLFGDINCKACQSKLEDGGTHGL